MPLLREDQAIIHSGVNGVNLPSVYSWSSFEGGDIEATDTKTRPGGMLPEVSLGGPVSRSDATVKRQYSAALHPYLVQLENVAGRASMWVSYTPLDANGNPSGGTVTITGLLKTVDRPNYDAQNSQTAFLTLVMSCAVEASISQ